MSTQVEDIIDNTEQVVDDVHEDEQKNEEQV